MDIYVQLFANNVARGGYAEDFAECAERVAELFEYALKVEVFVTV